MKKFKLLAALLIIPFFFVSCSSSDDEKPEDIYVRFVDVESVEILERLAGSISFSYEANVDDLEVSASPNWCSASLSGGKVLITYPTNTERGNRTASVTLKGNSGKTSASFSVQQKGYGNSLSVFEQDIKLPVSGAWASSAQTQNGEGIDKAIDNNLYSFYHSAYKNDASDYFPITLEFSFENVVEMDYIIYHPRADGGNGAMGKFDLFIETKSQSLSKYGEYDFMKSNGAGIINFTTPIENPTKIQFVVHSGGNDYLSCAEMEFYKSVENSTPENIFTDKTCSALKAGVTKADIEKIDNEFYRDLALELLSGNYDKEFRVQEFKPYQHPSVMSAINKTSEYSLRDNPTGIFVHPGDELVVLADLNGQNISLTIQDLSTGYGGISYPVSEGFNKHTISREGLIYVNYYTDSGEGNPIKLHFATGRVNGYFDIAKHKEDDWQRLINAATNKHFDIVGEYAHATFPVENFKTYTTNVTQLLEALDEMVYLEQEFMGLVKYDKMFRNRIYFMVDYGNSHMYATSYRTGYHTSTMYLMCNPNTFRRDVWGPAHEVGHVNQTRPGLKWLGMTEITNNIHSLYVQTSFGNTSRLMNEGTYSAAIREIVDKGLAHNAHSDFFYRLVPFWQLKLYLIDALGKEDFYKDLYEHYRVTPDLVPGDLTDGLYQLDFVRNVCRIANLDLTEFFEQWGFLTPINKYIEDYSKAYFTITEQQITDLKAEIEGMNLPKPKHNDIYLITDVNVEKYK